MASPELDCFLNELNAKNGQNDRTLSQNPGGIILQKQRKRHIVGAIYFGSACYTARVMNNALVRILFFVLLIAAALAFTLALSPTTAGSAYSQLNANAKSGTLLALTKAPAITAEAPTPTPEPVSQPGSTDGIVVMGLAIVLIIILPILLQRKLWMS